MTQQEFARIIALQDALWPHAKRPDDYAPVYELLEAVTYAEAEAAVKAHAAAGEDYPPNGPGIIRRAAAAQAGADRAADADLEGAFHAARRLGGLGGLTDDAAAELELRVGPELAAFVTLHYREWAMAGGPDGDPVTVVRAQLRQAWEAAGRRATTDAAHELAGVTPLRRVTPGDEAPAGPLRLPPSARPGA